MENISGNNNVFKSIKNMFKEAVSNYITLLLVAISVVIGYMTFSKVPDNLDTALEKIEQTELKIDESLKLLKDQENYLDSLIGINEGLLAELDTLKVENNDLSKSINNRLKIAHDYLWTIKRNIDRLPKAFKEPN